jgi:hypothetical protein
MKPVLRWILVLPTAVGAYIGIYVAIIILLILSCTCVPPEATAFTVNEHSWKEWVFALVLGKAPWILQILLAGIAAFFFVWVGAEVAPNHKASVAVVLALILVGLVAAMDIASHRYSIGIRILDIIVAIIACGFACVKQIQKAPA